MMEENLAGPTFVDDRLAHITGSKTVGTIDDVIEVMRELDGILPNEDGLKWFNLLYLKVTEAVKETPPEGDWEDPQWLERLDVVFANLYFNAIASWQRNPQAASRAWRPLLDCRHRAGIAKIQFALAGMNAHINHDLAIAVVRTDEEHGLIPRRGSAQHRDFERVNTLLEIVEEQVKHFFATGIIAEIDHNLGRVDDVIALWKVRKARDTAWTNAEILWQLRSLPALRDKFLLSLDRLVGLSSKGLLVPAG